MWIGIDDTDSRDGGCTTFICFEFVCRLYEKGYCLTRFPRLIRLNPQVPWKTRGNGAIAVDVAKNGGEKVSFARRENRMLFLDPHAKDDNVNRKEVTGILEEVLDEYAELDASDTNPAYVVSSHQFPNDFYQQAVHEMVQIENAVSIIESSDGSYTLMKNGRGVIGATAAISWDEKMDHTYELISYRKQSKWKTPRFVDDDSVIMMDLGKLQELTGRPDAASFVEVAALCAGCPIEDIVAQIKAKVPGTSVIALQNVVNQRMSSVRFVQKLALSISLVILVTASAMVGLSMLSAVNERTRDIGILRSLGYSRSQVFLIFCVEAGLIGIVAGVIGYLAGYGLSIKALEYLSFADGARPLFSVAQLIVCATIFPLITISSALYPAWKGAPIEPSQALVSL